MGRQGPGLDRRELPETAVVNPMRHFPAFLALALVLLSGACRTPEGPAKLRAEFGDGGIPVDWGNVAVASVPSSPEASVANAAARRLNQAATLAKLVDGWPAGFATQDAIVAVPLTLLEEPQNQPFGDGQANGSIAWPGWPAGAEDVPVIAYAATSSSGRILVVEAAQELMDLVLPADGAVTVELGDEAHVVTAAMTFDAERKVFRTLFSDVAALAAKDAFPTSFAALPDWSYAALMPDSWGKLRVRFARGSAKDERAWPLLFRFPAGKTGAILASLSEDQRKHKHLSNVASWPFTATTTATPYEQLKTWQAAAGDSVAHFYPGAAGVHHEHAGHMTASGGVDTFVVEKAADAPKLQVLYTCFDGRNPEKEANWAVPSGAGWHVIGEKPNNDSEPQTYGESIVHNLESAGIFAGWGVRSPIALTGEAPFGARDVATFRVLRPGETFTTAQNHFHWYAIDAKDRVCATIWKHFCPLTSDMSLGCASH